MGYVRHPSESLMPGVVGLPLLAARPASHYPTGHPPGMSDPAEGLALSAHISVSESQPICVGQGSMVGVLSIAPMVKTPAGSSTVRREAGTVFAL